MPRLVTVVVIHSLSYTGTTWLNAVLGSHPRTFALGPPNRVYERREHGWDDACLIHGASCTFWPEFHGRYDAKRNFFLQLAEASGRDVIVINNPTADIAASELRHPDILLKPINLIRDGRALAASYVRHNGKPFIDAVTKFLGSSFPSFYFDPANTDTLCLRYEDINREKRSMLNAVGPFVGLEYSPTALQFWRHEHHLSSGNHALMALIKMGHGEPVSHLKERDFYEAEFRRMQQGEDAPFEDDRWTEELTLCDRFLFDFFCGPDNERFGYERDRFTVTEVSNFWRELRKAAATDKNFARVLARAEVAQFDAVLASGGWRRLQVRIRRQAQTTGRRIARLIRRAAPVFLKRVAKRFLSRAMSGVR